MSSRVSARIHGLKDARWLAHVLGMTLAVTAFCLLLAAPRGQGQEVPRREFSSELVVPTGHIEEVGAIAFSRDGQLMASAGYDSMIWLWDTKSWQVRRKLSNPTGSNAFVTFSPNGELLASCDSSTLILWDVTTGRAFKRLSGSFYGVVQIAFTPDSKWLATTSFHDGITVWDVATGATVVKSLKGHSDPTLSVAFSPDGKIMASSGDDGVIIFWEVGTWRKSRLLNGHERVNDIERIWAVEFSPDGKSLASSSYDNTVRLWDVATGKQVKVLRGAVDLDRAVAFSPGGEYVASSGDNNVQVWHVKTGQLYRTFVGHTGTILAVKFSQNGEQVISCSGDKSVKVWDLETGHEVLTLPRAERISTVTLSSDGKLLALGRKHEIRLWDLTTSSEPRTLKGHTDNINKIVFSPAGARVLASASSDQTIKLWDSVTGGLIRELPKQTGALISVEFSPDGKFLAGGGPGGVKVWEVGSGRELALPTQQPRVGFDARSVAFSPDGHSLAGGGHNTITLWEIPSRRAVNFQTDIGWVGDLTFSPDGKTLAGKGPEGFSFLDLASGETRRHNTLPDWLRFSSFMNVSEINNRMVWAEIRGTEVWFLDALTRKQIATLYPLDQNQWAVVSADGRFDASRGALDLLHYTDGLTTYRLGQLKKYYQPGLLSKVLGFDQTSFDEPELGGPKPFPHVEVQEPAADSEQLIITVKNGKGGIGKVVVFVNGAERVVEEFRTERPTVNVSVDLKDKAIDRFLIPGGLNKIKVVAYSIDDSSSSPAKVINYLAPAATVKSGATAGRLEPPALWVVAVGISDYGDEKLRLNNAAREAEDVSAALRIAGERLFPGKVNITTLSTGSADPARQPTKANIVNALKEVAAKARAIDTLILFLDGHGVSHASGSGGDYHFLTAEAATKDLSDDDVRRRTALSGMDIEKLTLDIPTARRVLILDTCAAGRFIFGIGGGRGNDGAADGGNIDPVNQRAWQRMHDRTGFWVLASNAAADNVYEDMCRAGQSCLTYSLLKGMKVDFQRALARDPLGSSPPELVDVSRLFNYAAEEVSLLSNGRQRPQFIGPRDALSFAIGRVFDVDRSRIPLAMQKPVFILSDMQRAGDAPGDPAQLTRVFDTHLRTAARSRLGQESRIIFWDTPREHEVYRLTGRYHVAGKQLKVSLWLKHLVKKGDDFEESDVGEVMNFTAEVGKLDEAAQAVLKEVMERLSSAP